MLSFNFIRKIPLAGGCPGFGDSMALNHIYFNIKGISMIILTGFLLSISRKATSVNMPDFPWLFSRSYIKNIQFIKNLK
jgi:hypothetical protein